MQNRALLEISRWKQKLSRFLVKLHLRLFKNTTDFPFEEERIGSRRIRTFSKDSLQDDMVWHRDRENRLVIPLNSTDWLYQQDNELPVPLKKDRLQFIPRNVYHRLLVGKKDLVVEIREIE